MSSLRTADMVIISTVRSSLERIRMSLANLEDRYPDDGRMIAYMDQTVIQHEHLHDAIDVIEEYLSEEYSVAHTEFRRNVEGDMRRHVFSVVHTQVKEI